MGLAEIRSMWPAVLDALKSYSRVAWVGFAESVPVSLEGGVLAVAIANAGTVQGMRSSGHDERLRQAILDVLKTDVRIDVVLAPDAVAAAAASMAASSPAASAQAPAAAEPDVPSIDDADAADDTGVDLAIKALGATQIGEIDH